MARLRIEGYQFLSRANLANRDLGQRTTSPRQEPDVVFELAFAIHDKPFELDFAQLIPVRPSIGAAQFVDPEVDLYMTARWPRCIKAVGFITLPDRLVLADDLATTLLYFGRMLLWTVKDMVNGDLTADQFALTQGYRRVFGTEQRFDISGVRIPSVAATYKATDVGDYTGPGLVFLPDAPTGHINQLVWSQIIAFPGSNGTRADIPDLNKRILGLRRHYASYNELADARRHLRAVDLKGCIRSSASAADAVLLFYRSLWDVPMPARNLSFDDKIEEVLRSAGRPSYRQADPDNSKRVLYAYRARNSMHEGDNYYRDDEGKEVRVVRAEQAEHLLRAVEEFIVWIDALP